MGNKVQSGYHAPPSSHYRQFVNKRRRITGTQPDMPATPIPSEDRRRSSVHLTSNVITHYLLKNPAFLDDFIKDNIPLHRLHRWVRSNSHAKSSPDKSDVDDDMLEEGEYSIPEQDMRRLQHLNMLRNFYFTPLVPDRSEVERIAEAANFERDTPPEDADSPFFKYSEVPKDIISPLLIYMIENLFGRHGFDRLTLSNFVATVQVNYNDNEYHNFSHALCHAQSMYWILKEHPTFFNENEKKALMIAAMCHDIAHPGISEDFLIGAIGKWLFPSPVLERHHTQYCFAILMDENCNVFDNVDLDVFEEMLKNIKLCIISTFVQYYPQQLKRLRELIEGGFSFERKECKEAAMVILMMACDLSASWKTWDVHILTIWNLYAEFFSQGDKQSKLGLATPPIMMRDKMEDAPNQQIGFLENLAIPIFLEGAKVFPCLEVAVQATRENVKRWISDIK